MRTYVDWVRIPCIQIIMLGWTVSRCSRSPREHFVIVDNHTVWLHLHHHSSSCWLYLITTNFIFTWPYMNILDTDVTSLLVEPRRDLCDYWMCAWLGVWLCVSAAISHIKTWRILMALRMEIPVLHAYFVSQQIEYKSTVKVTNNMKTTVWAITFDPEVVETSSWFQNWVTWCQIKHTTDWSQNWYTHWLDLYCIPCITCIDQNNATYVSMATKYPIIKRRAFFKT